jgi:hypothetical protein
MVCRSFRLRASSSFSRSMSSRSCSFSCIWVSPFVPILSPGVASLFCVEGGQPGFSLSLDFFLCAGLGSLHLPTADSGCHRSFWLEIFGAVPGFCFLGGFFFRPVTVVNPSFCLVSPALGPWAFRGKSLKRWPCSWHFLQRKGMCS